MPKIQTTPTNERFNASYLQIILDTERIVGACKDLAAQATNPTQKRQILETALNIGEQVIQAKSILSGN